MSNVSVTVEELSPPYPTTPPPPPPQFYENIFSLQPSYFYGSVAHVKCCCLFFLYYVIKVTVVGRVAQHIFFRTFVRLNVPPSFSLT